ncbi:MAG: quinone-dependent dihydroorotate dehydrogenase [Calditrichaeota bacterium]|nr:MAG: quinone-dependent dihydroorotate dehydrogenase [Calditrichota bacterium]
MIYKKWLRPLLFRFDAEKVHNLAAKGLNNPIFRAGKQSLSALKQKPNPVQVMGLSFPNRLGMAAGFDKNGDYIHGLAALGFGFIETGTVTPKAQEGNPKPRLFRLPQDKAVINRMGFNNKGVHYLRANLEKRPPGVIIGGNIGKNKVTPNEQAVDDYVYCLNELRECVDYFTINISSPNTPDLRQLQDRAPLHRLLNRLQEVNAGFNRPRPLLVKIAPDMDKAYLDDVLEVLTENKITGIIATNTTVTRDGLRSSSQLIQENGGLSGRPLEKKSNEMIAYIRAHGSLTIIGVGGVFTGADMVAKIKAGAHLVQMYTGLIYEGPLAVRRILDYVNDRSEFNR